MLSFTTKQAPISWTDQGGGKPLERPTWAICFLVQSVVAVTGLRTMPSAHKRDVWGTRQRRWLSTADGFTVFNLDQCDVVDPVQLT